MASTANAETATDVATQTESTITTLLTIAGGALTILFVGGVALAAYALYRAYKSTKS